jgi:hypothetical protein
VPPALFIRCRRKRAAGRSTAPQLSRSSGRTCGGRPTTRNSPFFR